MLIPLFHLCRRGDLNSYGSPRLLLRQVRLPISPPRHNFFILTQETYNNNSLLRFTGISATAAGAFVFLKAKLFEINKSLSIPAHKPRNWLAPRLQTPYGVCNEAWAGIEPAHGGFADRSVTTSPPRLILSRQPSVSPR